MNNELIFSGVYILSIVIAATSQMMLKKAAQKEYKNKLAEYLNPLVVFAYGLFFLTTLIVVICFKYIPYSTGMALDSTSYIFVGLLSFLVLKEKYSKRKLLGTLLIVVGIVVFSI